MRDKADLSPKAFVDSSSKTTVLRDEVRAFLVKLAKQKKVTGWHALPVNSVADYITGYIIGTMAGKR